MGATRGEHKGEAGSDSEERGQFHATDCMGVRLVSIACASLKRECGWEGILVFEDAWLSRTGLLESTKTGGTFGRERRCVRVAGSGPTNRPNETACITGLATGRGGIVRGDGGRWGLWGKAGSAGSVAAGAGEDV